MRKDIGELQKDLSSLNNEIIGINLWDEKIEVGSYNTDGTKREISNYSRNVNPIAIMPNTVYYTNKIIFRYYYTSDMQFISRDASGDNEFTSPSNAYYMNISQAISDNWSTECCINISDPLINGTYYPCRGLKKDVSDVYDIISDAYTPNHTYQIGDYCIYNNELWKYTQATSSVPSSANATKTSVGNELSVKSYNLSDYKTDNVTSISSSLLKKSGNVVTISAQMNFLVLNTDDVLFNLPDELNPKQIVYFLGFTPNSIGRLYLDNRSKICSYGANPSSNFFSFTITYLI